MTLSAQHGDQLAVTRGIAEASQRLKQLKKEKGVA
jgi:hypothetical protein